MRSKPVEYAIGVLILAVLLALRMLVPAAPLGDFLLVTLVVFAGVADLPLLLVLIGVALLWIGLYPGVLADTFLTALLPLAVFVLRKAVLVHWYSWAVNAFMSVAAVVVFNLVLHPHAFIAGPGSVALHTFYAFLYSIVLFGMLRWLYVAGKR